MPMPITLKYTTITIRIRYKPTLTFTIRYNTIKLHYNSAQLQIHSQSHVQLHLQLQYTTKQYTTHTTHHITIKL